MLGIHKLHKPISRLHTNQKQTLPSINNQGPEFLIQLRLEKFTCYTIWLSMFMHQSLNNLAPMGHGMFGWCMIGLDCHVSTALRSCFRVQTRCKSIEYTG